MTSFFLCVLGNFIIAFVYLNSQSFRFKLGGFMIESLRYVIMRIKDGI